MTDRTMQQVRALIEQLDLEFSLAVTTSGPDATVDDHLATAVAKLMAATLDRRIVAMAVDALRIAADGLLADGDTFGAEFTTMQANRLHALSVTH